MGEDRQQSPAGWYPDSLSPTQDRYWDGTRWTEDVRPSAEQRPNAGASADAATRRQRPLRTALVAVGVLLLASCAVLGFFGFSLARQGQALDRESKAYVESLLPRVVSTWDQQALEDELSPELAKVLEPKQLDQFFKLFGKLGPLKSVDRVTGESHVQTSQPVQITATYRCQATFEKAPAEIRVALIKHGDRWQVCGFRVNSDYFLEKLK